MYYTAVQNNRPSRRKWFAYGGFFFFCLIFLLAGSMPSLFDLPGLQARFTGVSTTALASANSSCGSDDEGNSDGFLYTYTFTDRSGKVYRVTSGACSSGIVSDGENVTIWYQANNPTHLITKNDLVFDAIFFVGFSIPMLLFIAFLLVLLFRVMFRSERRIRLT